MLSVTVEGGEVGSFLVRGLAALVVLKEDGKVEAGADLQPEFLPDV